MKTILAMLALALCTVAGVGAAVALAGSEGGEDKVTLCHAAGLAGTTQYVTLTVGYPAAYGPAGHFDENGTPNAGHEQDYLGACEGDETTPTDTTPTTTTPTVPDDEPTTPTVTQPPHVVTGAASVICDRGAFVYRVSGSIDGQSADSVTPATIPGGFAGTTNVVVTRGDTTFRTSVTTNGDCGPPGGPPTSSTPSSTTPAVPTTPPAATTPDTTTGTQPGKPAEANPPAANSPQPKTPAAATPTPQGAPVKPAPGKPCPDGTRMFDGKCHAVVQGSG